MKPVFRLLLCLVLVGACADSPAAPSPDADADAGAWRTWVLASGSVLRPSPPPPAGSAAELAELEQVRALQAAGSISAEEIRRWDGAPSTAWTYEVVDRLEFYWPLLPDVRLVTPVRASRVLALLHIAIHDALVAAWDAKIAYHRAPPHRADPRVRVIAAAETRSPSYPSEHAAAAAAAAAVLRYAFPLDAASWEDLPAHIGQTRVAAGVAFPSDVEAGLAIGRAVGAAVVAHAMNDGSHSLWEGEVPAGDGKWRPTPPRHVAIPFDVNAGQWHPWVLHRADAFRPAPPPAPGSVDFVKDLDELRQIAANRTTAQADLARYWATGPPPLRWTLLLEEEIARRRLSPARAARAHALVSVAMYDAMLACWDAKFHYWLARPITMDTDLVTVTSTPPFPSYPSGHSTMSFAAYQVMTALFPDGRARFLNYAEDASISRVYGGIHYRFDIVAGDSLGAAVGRMVAKLVQ